MTIEGIGWTLELKEGDELKVKVNGKVKGTLSFEDEYRFSRAGEEDIIRPAQLYWTDESGRVEVLG